MPHGHDVEAQRPDTSCFVSLASKGAISSSTTLSCLTSVVLPALFKDKCDSRKKLPPLLSFLPAQMAIRPHHAARKAIKSRVQVQLIVGQQ